MAKKKDAAEDRIVAVEEALSKTEQFIENNQKYITYGVIAIIAVILIFFGYRKFVQLPKEKNAQLAIYKAQNYFEADSIDLALFGDGESYGFVDIVDDFGSTEAGNLAKYYSGVCYLQKGEYEEAISYLKKFKSNDLILPSMALGAIGDAYMQLGDIDKAIDYYLDAAAKKENDFTSPTFLMKAGWALEINKEYAKALEIFEKVKKEFPKARESRDTEKYIARIKAQLGEL